MKPLRHAHHRHQHFAIHYPVSAWEKFYVIFLAPLLVFFAVAVLFRGYVSPSMELLPSQVSLSYVGAAMTQTFGRLLIAYVLALVVAVPLAVLAVRNAFMERLLLPTFDIIQSIPVLAFFPIVIVTLLKFGLYSWSAVLVLFMSMLWNIVFSVVGGLKIVPNDIKSAAQIFHVKGLAYFFRVLLPSMVPYLVTGSLLAWAQGWNILIVVEMLHTYVPGAADLFGIGSLLVHSVAQGRNDLFFAAMGVLVLTIAAMNFFVWQKLLHYAERFKFD